MVSLTMIRSSGDGTELSMTAVASKAPGTGTGSVLTVPAKLTVAVALCRWALCRPSLLTPSHGKPQTWTNILLLLAQWPFRLPFTLYATFTKTSKMANDGIFKLMSTQRRVDTSSLIFQFETTV